MIVNHSFFCKATDIASVSLDIKGGYVGIGNFVMNTPGHWQYFELPNMIFEQVKEKTKRNWWRQRMYFDIPSKEVWEMLKEHYELPCNLVAAHYLVDVGHSIEMETQKVTAFFSNRGHYVIQGIEPELLSEYNYVTSKYFRPKMILPREFDPQIQGLFESGSEALSSFCFLTKSQFEAL